MMLGVYFFLDIYPFGGRSLLTADMNQQYVNFFSYFRIMILEGESPFYTFSKNLGGDMIGLLAYYLLSPLNIIFLLFRTENLQTAVLLLTLLKIGLSGFTMNIFLNRDILKLDSILFSTAYAFMSYNIVYQQNIMWLDGIILLPLIIWGIEKIVKNQAPFAYIFSLAAAIIANYYIGYMLCFFSVLYFICHLLFFQNKAIISFKNKSSLKPILSFSISSLLAGGLSAFVLLPALHSMQGVKRTYSFFDQGFSTNFDILDFFSKLFIGAYSDEQLWLGLPNIYCGLFITVLVILFFINNKLKARERFGWGLLLVIIFACFYVSAFNLAFHGFGHPVGFPYRYSFLFSFTIILIAHKGYINVKEDLTFKKVILIFTAFLIFALFMEKIQYEFLRSEKIYLTMIFAALMLSLVLLYAKRSFRALIILIACICFLDLGTNAYLIMSKINYSSYHRFVDYIRINEPIIKQIKEEDSSFYRLEKTYARNFHNDAMMFNYNGLSHFSSSEKTFVKKFMEKMGFRNYGLWARYHQGSTISVDSLLGIKYLLTDEPTQKPYDLIGQHENIYLYQNPFALPLGFLVNEEALNVALDKSNLFELQNDIWGSMVNQPQDKLFTPALMNHIHTSNIYAEKQDNGIHYIREDNSQDAFIEFHIQMMSDDPLYAYFPTEQMRPVEIFINGDSFGTYFDHYHYHILSLGNFTAGEQMIFKMMLIEDEAVISEPLFYHQDMSIFTDYYNELIISPVQITHFSDSHFEGIAENHGDKQYALFTVAFDKGWKVRLNGKPANVVTVFDTLIAVEIPEGSHHITFRYIPGKLYLGIAITACSLLILVGGTLYLRKRVKKLPLMINQRPARPKRQ
jgi:uncharacterized membrane protein YfhO